MIALKGTVIFWFVAQGLVIGYLFGRLIKREGVTLPINVWGGAIASVLSGSMAVILGLGDGLLFALLGTLAMLFLLNVFHQHHVVDVYGEIDRGIKLKGPSK